MCAVSLQRMWGIHPTRINRKDVVWSICHTRRGNHKSQEALEQARCFQARRGGDSMNDIRIFDSPEFGEVRTVMIDGEPWFVGKDVASALGYKNTRQALSTNIEDDDRGVHSIDTPSGTQQMTVINESGLYSLIFGSKLDSAKKFKRWVTSEALPALRKDGYYGKLPPMTTEQQIQLLAQGNVDLSKRIDTVQSKTETLEERFNRFEQELPLFPHEADSVSSAVKKRVVEVLGGKNSNAYHNRSISQMAFMDAYRNLKRNFNVRSYKSIKRNQADTALRIAMEYEPPLFLEEQIENCNAQMSMDV